MRLETKILSNLIYNEEYCRKVIPFLTPLYFAERTDRILSQEILKFFSNYNKLVTKDVLLIEIGNRTDLSDIEVKQLNESVLELSNEPVNEDWLIENTEKFCKDRAVYNAILASIKIIDGKDLLNKQDAIPSILSEALAVSFDNSVGHDYINDAEARFEFYHRTEEKLSFGLDLMDKITAGGLSRKSLNVVLAGTGAGKTLFMGHLAAVTLLHGKNVLYITMEMAEERIAERIDANLLNTSIDQLELLPHDVYTKKIEKLKEKTLGKLIVKEYPTASAGSSNFRHLLNELRLKKKFTPDIIYIDYLNICSSSRVKQGANVNSYTYIKSIAEELRGLAVEFNVPIVSATQTTRSGFTNSDVGLEDTSESFGLPATADFMIAMVTTDELQQLNQIMFKQLKNRFTDLNKIKRFVVGVDKSKMKLYDVEQSAQADIVDDTPMFDKSTNNKFTKEAFRGFS